MKTNSRFIIGLVAAAVTFGSLLFFVGKHHCAQTQNNQGHGCYSQAHNTQTETNK